MLEICSTWDFVYVSFTPKDFRKSLKKQMLKIVPALFTLLTVLIKPKALR